MKESAIIDTNKSVVAGWKVIDNNYTTIPKLVVSLAAEK